MRLTILGGGGFRVPLVHSALVSEDSGVETVVLHDTDPQRVRAVRSVIDEASPGHGPEVIVEDDLATAVQGADFVFSAIRVGGLRGRTCDERSALAEGVLGQETTGAGGVCYGLRTIPVAMTIAEAVRRHAPEAWVINFTNPAGMVTEAMSRVLGERVIGICDSPVGLFRRVARALEVDPAAAWFDYAGLNHLGWLRRVLVDGEDRLPRLLADDDALASFEEGQLFGGSWLRALGMIPNEYLYYYYFTQDAIASISEATATRGEFLREQQDAFYRAAGEPGAAKRWEEARREREATYMSEGRQASGAGSRNVADLDGGGYDKVALSLMRAIAADERATLVLNVRNRSAVPDLDEDAVVEVPCLVGRNGAHPLAAGALDSHAAGLMTSVKATERATIDAALSGSRSAAVKALAIHPLVGSVRSAERILTRELEALPELNAVLTLR
ncbi:6-phospho-beta-glucosidase [Actinobacteria bacterium YIM 96077]|uniref:6-phospho-beta-glucosidase n=1 Tax=Phytoactinopolyspora halophila TaxID=1981511 RepID=A0A329QCA3_9ACTN|nr:6-phospho-beta-glucosidase [Phytoactinopolyspora halophila]AYY14110.1 6-phospho-beta-glucosidase [Actinobacteria bacterium YIM 96077]RAW09954.1 6-phospho-beta-glucosidase [Phytoactinopolyspora halophila]